MQPSERDASARRAEVGSAFGDRAKSARLRAGLTQQQLCDRLGNSLDTSAITRIEAGQREPRLSEALAIARELGFELDDLAPRADLDAHLRDVTRSMEESRAALVTMLRSVDPVVDFVRRNPDCLGGDRLEDRVREVAESFSQRVSPDDVEYDDPQALNFAVTTTRTDERLKRQLLRAVNDGILVSADELQPAHQRWFKDDAGDEGGPRQRTATRADDEQWQHHFGQLLGYVRRHGDARVPRSHVSPDGGALGAWVVDQRNRFAQGTLDPDRAMRLEELPGWTWGPRSRRNAARPRTT